MLVLIMSQVISCLGHVDYMYHITTVKTSRQIITAMGSALKIVPTYN